VGSVEYLSVRKAFIAGGVGVFLESFGDFMGEFLGAVFDEMDEALGPRNGWGAGFLGNDLHGILLLSLIIARRRLKSNQRRSPKRLKKNPDFWHNKACPTPMSL
jgi:hypothetical protein